MSLIPIFVVFLVIGLPILCLTVIILVAILRGGRPRQRRAAEMEETRMIQELHQSLNRLETRIESLETILIEKERQKEEAP